jgi:hypothetical protein
VNVWGRSGGSPIPITHFTRYQTLFLSNFWTLLPPFRNNEKLEAQGFWLLGTTACRVNQLDFLQHMIPTAVGDLALGCGRLSPSDGERAGKAKCISGIVRFHDVIGISSLSGFRFHPSSLRR